MKLYNTLSKKIEFLNPIKKEKISLYVCGITPYDAAHLGHIKTYATFDILNRVLNFLGLEVNYIQNITDIDTPLFKKAKESGIPYEKIARIETKKFKKNLTTLNIIHPNKFVRVSDSLETIVSEIGELINSKNAYVSDNVYFNTKKNFLFGNLSNLTKSQMLQNKTFIKTESNLKNKKNPLDFLLWKITKEFPNWKSPWGNGQPGWHIECSTIIKNSLGEQIDIHGGGDDLIFPHHECEIAQSESLTNKFPFVKYWMHVAPLKLNGKKMSKSTGNLIFASDILKSYSPNSIRLYLASNHYRKSQEYNEEELDKFEEMNDLFQSIGSLPVKKVVLTNHFAHAKKIISELKNDLNTPLALKYLINFAQEINKKGFSNLEEIKKFKELKNLFGV